MANRCLNEDGPMRQYNFPDSNILIMKKTSIDEKQAILLVYNKNWEQSIQVKIADIERFLTLEKPIYEISIDRDQKPCKDVELDLLLKPNEFVLFIQE